MVDAYVTTLASCTLAVSGDRLLLENSPPAGVLSLHPGISSGGETHSFKTVTAFTAGEGLFSAAWKAVSGFEARTELRARGENRLELRVVFRNASDAPLSPSGLHPLFFAPAGPGACAVGSDALRVWTWGSDAQASLQRIDGPITGEMALAFFPEAGTPCLLLGTLEKSEPPLRAAAEGARGKALALRLDAPLPQNALAPGEENASPPILLILGEIDAADALSEWADALDDSSISEALNAFDPAAEIAEPEPESTPEADMDWENGLVDQEEADLEADEEDTASDENAATDEAEQPATAEPDEDSSPESTSGDAEELPEDAPRGGRRRTAFLRRAMRASEGVWPGYGQGRRYPPQTGDAVRTRRNWRAEMPAASDD